MFSLRCGKTVVSSSRVCLLQFYDARASLVNKLMDAGLPLPQISLDSLFPLFFMAGAWARK